MKVKLMVSRAGPAGVQNRGDVVEVSAEEGQRMIDKGQAELIRAAKKPEKAVRSSKVEKAAE